MSIVSSLITDNRLMSDGTHKVSELHTDHIGKTYAVSYIANNNHDFNTSLANNAISIDQSNKDTEISNGISECYSGRDPLNITPFNPITPDYQTWDEMAIGVSLYFLEQTNQLELQWWALSNNGISSTDKKRIWGMGQSEVSDVNSAVQIAIDLQASLDLYSPFFIDGVLQ